MNHLLARVVAFLYVLALPLLFAVFGVPAFTNGTPPATGFSSTFLSTFDVASLPVSTFVVQEQKEKSPEQETEETSDVQPEQPQTTTQAVTTQTAAPINQPTQTQPTTPTLPYSLTTNGVAADVANLGYSIDSLYANGIAVVASNGKINRRCASGTSGQQAVQGMALRTNVNYIACPNGQSPVYDAYYAEGATCTVLYNKQASNKNAVLAHELAHCVHFTFGQYRAFDIEFRKIRPSVNKLNTAQMAEVIADDISLCSNNISTNWSVSYYDRYGVSAPTAEQCSSIAALTTNYLTSNL